MRILKCGFIDTNMTDGRAPKFLCASKRYVAKTLIKNPFKEGIEYMPWWWFFVMKLVSIMPGFITSRL